MTQKLSIVEATVADLEQALASGHTNSVELVAKHLHRIAKYDRRGILLNSVPIINPNVFADAQASDERRCAGLTLNALDGIPCTIKDSYKIKGMTVASGSPAFASLIATEDAFTVAKIKSAGAVIMGKTNMPPMAAGGMQRGVYGRAESPYNEEYLTAAFASGSSNGSATATAASFGVFGMGEETISSGRSPASNNGLVAYTPSRGLISIRGNWPLFPTCDTVVPHTRTMPDMFSLLDVIVAQDENKYGDFWREQPFVTLPHVDDIRPKSYHDLSDKTALSGKRIGVPKMYIGGYDSEAIPVHTRKSVINLWHNARQVLESLGATVEEVEFPVVTNFEKVNDVPNSSGNTKPAHRSDIDMSMLMAYTWDDFLIRNGDTSCPTTLASVDSSTIFPRPPGSIPDRYDDTDPLVRHKDVVAHITGGRLPTFEIPGLGPALQELENRRKSDYEDWLVEKGLDAVVWPCNGDVGRADADINEASAQDAWRNGVLYSNGNCAIRQLGIPTVSVPMGVMEDTKMPVNLTFASKAYDDSSIFRYAFAFESASKLRQRPGRTPNLTTDTISLDGSKSSVGSIAPELSAKVRAMEMKDERVLQISGSCRSDGQSELQLLRVFVDGEEVDQQLEVKDGKWEVEAKVFNAWTGRPEERGVPNPDLAMIVIVATGRNGRSTGKLLFA